MLHVYDVMRQPAIRFVDRFSIRGSDVEVECGYSPGSTLYPDCCHKPRLAEHCSVQCYYDCIKIWCHEDKGCNDPDEIAAKKQKEFDNRSKGQKRRRHREKVKAYASERHI